MQKVTIFDNNKQSGKAVDIFSSRRTEALSERIQTQDRNVSPFRGYKQMNNEQSKSVNYGVSRGIFQPQKKDGFNTTEKNPMTMSRITSTSSILEPERSTYGLQAQIFQDFLEGELQSHLANFKADIMHILLETLNEYKEKTSKNQEMINGVRDNLKTQSQTIGELDKKIEEYNTNLNELGSLIQSELEYIKKKDLGGTPFPQEFPLEQIIKVETDLKAYTDHRMKIIEDQQEDLLKNLDELKFDISNSVRLTLEQYSDFTQSENEEKFKKLANDINLSNDKKLLELVEVFNQKLAEMQKPTSLVPNERYEMLIAELETKIQERDQQYKTEFENLEKKKVDISALSEYLQVKKFAEVMDQFKTDFEFGRDELSSQIKACDSVLENYDKKFKKLEQEINDKFKHLELQVTKSPEKNSSNSKNSQLENKFLLVEEIQTQLQKGQEEIESELDIQRSDINSIRTVANIAFSEIKTTQAKFNSEVARLGKLHDFVFALSNQIDGYKSALDTFEENLQALRNQETQTKQFEGNTHRFSFLDRPSQENVEMRTSNDVPYFRKTGERNSSEEVEVSNKESLSATANEEVRSSGLDSLDPRFSFGGPISPEKINEIMNERNSVPTVPSVNINLFANEKSLIERNSITDIPNAERDSVIDLPAQERTSNSISNNLSSPVKTTEEYGDELFMNQRQSLSGVPQDESHSVSRPTIMKAKRSEEGSIQESPPLEYQSIPEKEEDEVEYFIDDNGYLIDEDGEFVLDDKGNCIQLTEEQLETLKKNKAIEENS